MTVAYPNLCYNKVCYEGTALYDHAHMARTVKTCVKQPLSKRPKIGFQDQLLLNAGQKYCRMLQGEHSAILSTFIKLPFVIETFVLSIFEWPFYTGFTVPLSQAVSKHCKPFMPNGLSHQLDESISNFRVTLFIFIQFFMDML